MKSHQRKRVIWRAIITGLFSLTWVVMSSGIAFSAEGGQKPAGIKAQQPASPAKAKTTKKSFPDGGSDGSYDPGIDLVVSSVEITKGVFAGEHKIQIIPTIKNMWNGRTRSRIKILLEGLSSAEWIEGGIGPNEEKRGGALYVSYDPRKHTILRFSAVVDNSNEIPENNDLNNRCENISFSTLETHKIHTCPIVGPHGPLR